MKKLLALVLSLVLCLNVAFALAESDETPLGAVCTYTDDDEDHGFAFTAQVLCVARGESAKKVLTRWDSSNTVSGKNKEWMLVKVHLEALSAQDGSISLKSRHFKFVSQNGVEYTRCTIVNNPAEMENFYVGGEQDAWLACIVDKDDTPALVYSPAKGTNVWLSLSHREAETVTIAETLKRGSSDGDAVLRVEERLLELGYFDREPDRKYDSDTITAVRKFQHDAKLKNDGAVSQETADAMFAAD